MYKGKTVAVVGGGDVAVEDAIYLARMCTKVYLIHRRDSLRAAKVLQDKVFQLANVELIWDSFVTEVGGSDVLDHITVKNKNTQAEQVLNVAALFVAVGMDPNSRLCPRPSGHRRRRMDSHQRRMRNVRSRHLRRQATSARNFASSRDERRGWRNQRLRLRTLSLKI
ncbi:MAG: NAD(P)/FAD-dependent oxidoreductase [Bacillus subtilis]|nr:NAD(P)/FAD-dependent oxidoreductase [Bacillus subtilis]